MLAINVDVKNKYSLIGLGNIGCGYDYDINFEVDKPESSQNFYSC